MYYYSKNTSWTRAISCLVGTFFSRIDRRHNICELFNLVDCHVQKRGFWAVQVLWTRSQRSKPSSMVTRAHWCGGEAISHSFIRWWRWMGEALKPHDLSSANHVTQSQRHIQIAHDPLHLIARKQFGFNTVYYCMGSALYALQKHKLLNESSCRRAIFISWMLMIVASQVNTCHARWIISTMRWEACHDVCIQYLSIFFHTLQNCSVGI